MNFSNMNRRAFHWSCDKCRASHGPEPGFKWYWCDKESGGCDYCPNCYPSIEITLTKKGYEAFDPTNFETKQIVYWKKGNNYVQIKSVNKNDGTYLCRVMIKGKNDSKDGVIIETLN